LGGKVARFIKYIFNLTSQKSKKHTEAQRANFYASTKKNLITKLVVTGFVVVFSFFLSPASAEAGVFSFVADLFRSKADAHEDVSTFNSQNMPLLKAPTNPNSAAAIGGGDITIVNDSALLPETGPVGTADDIENNKLGQISVYIVKEGDTLGDISLAFDVTVNTIIWANDLKNSTIKPGDELVILPVSGVQHTIKKGDTVSSLAAKYKADADEIIAYNELNADEPLKVGDVITIPDGEIAAQPKKHAPSGKLIAGGGPSYPGYYIRPIAGVKTQGLHGYNGVDIATPTGTAIHAAASGQVIVSTVGGWNRGYGNYIVVQHPNGTQTLYAHTSRNIVSRGETVYQGQVIGYVGNTGKSTGPHLHFEIRGARNPF